MKILPDIMQGTVLLSAVSFDENQIVAVIPKTTSPKIKILVNSGGDRYAFTLMSDLISNTKIKDYYCEARSPIASILAAIELGIEVQYFLDFEEFLCSVKVS